MVLSARRYMSPRVIDAVAEVPALCPMFHIPFQSGDDGILRDMGRGHTAARYREIVHNIRTRLPDAAITADAIVGFRFATSEVAANCAEVVAYGTAVKLIRASDA